MKILEQLFDSRARLRLMRLFLLNPQNVFEIKDLVIRTKEKDQIVRKEINILEKTSFVKKIRILDCVVKKPNTKKNTKKHIFGLQLNQSFPYLEEIERLLTVSASLKNEDIISKIKKAGNIKLVVLSGIFIRESDSVVDILIVGDKIKKHVVESALGSIEAELGKELTYAFFETNDFKYRIGVYDKFIRDIFDYPHKKIINKLNILNDK